MEAHKKLQKTFAEVEKERAKLEARIERIEELYKWGDMSKGEYIKEREQIQQEIKRLTTRSLSTK